MSTKHTPGPWNVVNTRPEQAVEAMLAARRELAAFESEQARATFNTKF
jgi:hypothetical protein